jgi:3-isopropylmalate/(R)-2-methylmalate dehydratase small subunit
LEQGHSVCENESRAINPDFILNQSPYDKAELLLARENFGCGSSREHAVWALNDFGIKVVLAPSFGDIFYNNSFKNGFLPILLAEDEIEALFVSVNAQKGLKATVNLEEQMVETEEGNKYLFDIAVGLKDRLLKGLDDIGLTLAQSDEIRRYEKERAKITPWMFQGV